MSSLTLQSPAPGCAWPAWREHGLALGMALALHLGVAFVLFNLSHTAPLPVPVTKVLTTQLVALPAPVEHPPAPPAPPVVAPPMPAPEPVVAAPPVAQADLALKRVEQARREKAQQHAREQQQRREDTRQQAQRARDEQQRQAQQLQQQQQQAQAREADARREAAAAAARAESEAASRQYLPIAKQAPDYPQRALDRKLEGECTVAYRVNAQGRVEDPQVVGPCHPLFVKPSLAAAKAFRYQPRLVNGQAVAVANVKNTFTYRIQ